MQMDCVIFSDFHALLIVSCDRAITTLKRIYMSRAWALCIGLGLGSRNIHLDQTTIMMINSRISMSAAWVVLRARGQVSKYIS